VALAERGDSSVDHVFVHRRGAYGIVEVDVLPDTVLDASVRYQKDAGRYHLGVPLGAQNTDLGFSRAAYFGDARSRDIKDITDITLGLMHALAGDWSLKARYSHQDAMTTWHHYSYLNASLDEAVGSVLPLAHRPFFEWGKKSHVLDASAAGSAALFGRSHELAFGLNGARYRDEYQGPSYAVRPVDVFDFDPHGLEAITPTGTLNGSAGDNITTNLGVYGVARWNVADALKLITGLRVSNYQVKNKLSGVVQPKQTREAAPYAGLTYDLNAQYSAYLSYSDIFNPSARRSITGEFLAPVTGSNYEVGIKGELLHKRLNVSAAVFRLDQKNMAETDPDNPADPLCGGTCYVTAGKIRSEGVDLGASGQITPLLNVSAHFTHTQSEYVQGASKGQRYSTLQPKNNLRLAWQYRLARTGAFGGNVTASGKSYITTRNKTVTQWAYALLGLHARYQIAPDTRVQLAVNNLADKRYLVLYSDRYAPFGEPRKFTLNLRHEF